MEKIDFLAIGDIVTDAFIKLQDAEAYCDLDHENCKLCVRFGDKVPFESVTICHAVGNSPNAAVASARMGLKTSLLAVVGNDDEGKICLDTLNKNGVDTTYVNTDPALPTNYHYVLWYGTDRTILIKHAEYVRTMPASLPPVGWIYLSSLGQNTESFHHEIAQYIQNHPETKLAFQPGTFQMSLGIEKLKDLYENTEIFFCNKQEAEKILKLSDTEPKVLVAKLHDLGPKKVVMTDGVNGLYASDSVNVYHLSVYPDIAPPVERTGAGDATSSTITAMLATGKSFEEALLYGPINSMNVVQHIGAQEGLLPLSKIEEYLKNTPENYKLSKI
jgi:sugar/nucleoside kinase (ribokinase family)